MSDKFISDFLPKVKLQSDSINYIHDTFKKYKQIFKLPEVLKDRIVIHMYPMADTDTDTVYTDAIDSAIKIYIPYLNSFYIVPPSIKVVFVKKESNIRIFKDGSTCISVYGPITIHILDSLHVMPIK